MIRIEATIKFEDFYGHDFDEMTEDKAKQIIKDSFEEDYDVEDIEILNVNWFLVIE